MLNAEILMNQSSRGLEMRGDKPEAQGGWRRIAPSKVQVGAHSSIVDARRRKKCDDGGPHRRLGDDCKQAEPPVSLALKFSNANRVH